MKRTLSGWFLHNLPLKALSLLLAGLLWHQVSSQRVIQREVKVPVEFVNMPLDLEIVNDYVREVDVVVRSDRGREIIENRQLAAVVDLNMAQSGIQVIQLTPENITRAEGLEILRINPPQIRLVLEKTLTKSVKIEPQVVGEPAPGYELVSVKAVPSEIVVSGPQSAIKRVEVARTGPVDIDGASATVTEQTFVELAEPRLRINDSAVVSVIALIEEKRREVRVPGVQVQVQPPGAPVRLYDRLIEIMGTVPLSYGEKLDPSKFIVTVETEALEASGQTQRIEPQVTIPEEYLGVFRLIGTRPATVRVRKAG